MVERSLDYRQGSGGAFWLSHFFHFVYIKRCWPSWIKNRVKPIFPAKKKSNESFAASVINTFTNASTRPIQKQGNQS